MHRSEGGRGPGEGHCPDEATLPTLPLQPPAGFRGGGHCPDEATLLTLLLLPPAGFRGVGHCPDEATLSTPPRSSHPLGSGSAKGGGP